MARPREFDADVALEQAMQVFWDMGYQSASLSSLTRAMGISKSSFYEAFGSKHELYLSALEYYNATVSGRVLSRRAPSRRRGCGARRSSGGASEQGAMTCSQGKVV